MVQNYRNAQTVKVMEGVEEDEFFITRVSHTNPALNIVNVYGAIESMLDNQEVLESWGRIKTKLDKIKDRNEFCLLVGDFNRAIGAGRLGIKGNKPAESYGGKNSIGAARNRRICSGKQFRKGGERALNMDESRR